MASRCAARAWRCWPSPVPWPGLTPCRRLACCRLALPPCRSDQPLPAGSPPKIWAPSQTTKTLTFVFRLPPARNQALRLPSRAAAPRRAVLVCRRNSRAPLHSRAARLRLHHRLSPTSYDLFLWSQSKRCEKVEALNTRLRGPCAEMRGFSFSHRVLSTQYLD